MKSKLFEFSGSDLSINQKLSIFILSDSKMIWPLVNTPNIFMWMEKKASIIS